jgi:hypothetical protein
MRATRGTNPAVTISDNDLEPYLVNALGHNWQARREHPRVWATRVLADFGGKIPVASQRFRAQLKKYGITETVDLAMLSWLAHGGCWICGQPNPEGLLCVDHNHATNLFRGLLCHHCNLGIGRFNDNPDLLRQAAAYLS